MQHDKCQKKKLVFEDRCAHSGLVTIAPLLLIILFWYIVSWVTLSIESCISIFFSDFLTPNKKKKKNSFDTYVANCWIQDNCPLITGSFYYYYYYFFPLICLAIKNNKWFENVLLVLVTKIYLLSVFFFFFWNLKLAFLIFKILKNKLF